MDRQEKINKIIETLAYSDSFLLDIKESLYSNRPNDIPDELSSVVIDSVLELIVANKIHIKYENLIRLSFDAFTDEQLDQFLCFAEVLIMHSGMISTFNEEINELFDSVLDYAQDRQTENDAPKIH